MKVLVTGATGFIGSHLCDELLKRRYIVFGATFSENTQNIKPLLSCGNFHLKKCDILDQKAVSDMIKKNGIEIICHLAAKLPISNNDSESKSLYFDVNAKGTLNILKAAQNYANKIIYASSMSVYSEPPKYLPVDEKHPTEPSTAYGRSKLEGESYCIEYAKMINIIMLRYGGAYGRGQPTHNAIPRFINQALNNKPITIYGDGTQTSDYTYIKDIVQGTILAMEKNKPGVFNIGSGKEISVRDLAERIIDITNSKSEIILVEKDTNRQFRFAMDITKSQNFLGYSPHTLDEGLRSYISNWIDDRSRIRELC